MPQTMMQAIEISEPGGPEVLIPTERPVPTPKDNEVLIRVFAAGVNRPDCFQRAGLYPAPPGASDLPGLEVSGEVVAIGASVTRWRIGDRVAALTHGGGYAAFVVAHEQHCLTVPDNLDMTLAAAVPETAFTVYSNVWMRGRLSAGQTLLVHGGSSGIGSTAIQLAKAHGSRVITTAGSEAKCQFCEALGADVSINYKQEDWAEAVAAAAPDGVDVILDMVAGDYTAKNLSVLAMDGRYVVIALLGGPIANDVNMGLVLRKRLVVTGSTLRPQTDAQKAAIAAACEKAVVPLLANGGFVPMIYETFALKDAAKAHALMESGEHMGKIVLRVSEGDLA
ncbi:MAG: NAD(P)H-quinone oxidoreductase [Pseudomonadota bacterium]